VIDYVIASSDSIEDLGNLVNILLDKGFNLVGGMTFAYERRQNEKPYLDTPNYYNHPIYCQTMIKENKK
jgi:hypothetical protein